MAVYSYRATSHEGAIIEGFIEASDETAAIDRIKASGVIPLRVGAHKEDRSKRFSLGSSKTDVLTFTTELAALLGAGLPLDRSLAILSEISSLKTVMRQASGVMRNSTIQQRP